MYVIIIELWYSILSALWNVFNAILIKAVKVFIVKNATILRYLFKMTHAHVVPLGYFY